MLGRIYEYFLSQFASAEGKKGGEFYTPRSVVKLLVEMIEPYNGRVYDPCCGSSGMFVQSIEFIHAHKSGNGNPSASSGQVRKLKCDISIYGQESNYTTWRLAKMNLALRGIDGQIAHGDTFHNDRHPDLKADFILANPPFNISDWGGDRLRDDKRWQFGKPPVGNANFAWVQHIIHHLAPTGIAGFVLANGSMSSNQSGEGEIRKNIIEADLVDCMIALPGQLFYSTPIPACLWFLARDKKQPAGFRDRRGEVLFIDARKLGRMADRTHRELTDDEITRIAGMYHLGAVKKPFARRRATTTTSWLLQVRHARRHPQARPRAHARRYVGAEAQEDDGEPFEEKMKRLTRDATRAAGRRRRSSTPPSPQPEGAWVWRVNGRESISASETDSSLANLTYQGDELSRQEAILEGWIRYWISRSVTIRSICTPERDRVHRHWSEALRSSQGLVKQQSTSGTARYCNCVIRRLRRSMITVHVLSHLNYA